MSGFRHVFLAFSVALAGFILSARTAGTEELAKESCETRNSQNIDFTIISCTKLLAISHDAYAAKVHNFRGLAYMEKKEYDHALADFDQAIRIQAASNAPSPYNSIYYIIVVPPI